jgi:hypothetical protein
MHANCVIADFFAVLLAGLPAANHTQKRQEACIAESAAALAAQPAGAAADGAAAAAETEELCDVHGNTAATAVQERATHQQGETSLLCLATHLLSVLFCAYPMHLAASVPCSFIINHQCYDGYHWLIGSGCL